VVRRGLTLPYKDPQKRSQYATDWNRNHPERRREIRANHYQKYREKINRKKRQFLRQHKEIARIRNLIGRYPDKYPLADKCAFCNSTENLERGHLDYEDDGFNYLTVCHACNLWMDQKT